MQNNILNIVIGGEAGQGIVTVGQLLAKSLVRAGYSILVTQSYQSRIRGGHNTFAIRVSNEEIAAPQEQIDLLIALDADTINLHRNELSSNGIIMTDETFASPNDNCLKVPYKKLASNDKLSNIAALGIIGFILGIKEDLIASTINELFAKRTPAVVEENSQVLVSAFRWAAEQSIFFSKLPQNSKPANSRLMMNGNEAIALGAIAAGIKFYSFYPMTPSTSVGLTLIHHAKQMGIVVEQAEDEISAINMTIGASFAGAPSMAATSGGGFALMVEGVSLAAMTETPIVIIVGQRPAPATGLPTRTEQADLEFVLHAGHGEFPRAIFVPGTVEECFYLTYKAFKLAEQYQTPVFLLTDQFLADSYTAITPFNIKQISPIASDRKSQIVNFKSPYRRYAITDNGISPRLFPGLTQHLVIADSDEHTEEGHLTEDLSIRIQMVKKRLGKYDGIKSEVVFPESIGYEKPELLLISWGSTKGSALEAARLLNNMGKSVETLNFSQVWPMVTEQFIAKLEEARQVICIEGNATGQLARLIRRETGFKIKDQILRYDGLPITPEFILRNLKL